MSQADELLEKLTEDDLDPLAEEHIVIGNDRYVTVPEPLQRIAVQYDHNVETVTFDCPRYWDEHDLSTMYIYINFLRKDGFKGIFLTKNLRIDEADENLIHFEWTIGQDITLVEGPIKFLVCAMETDEDGYERIHWNSEINEQMFVSLGLESEADVVERNEAIITDLLARMDALTGKDAAIDGSLTQSGIAADAAVVGQRLSVIDERLNTNDTNIETINNRLDGHDTEIEEFKTETTTNVEAINTNIESINNNIKSNETRYQDSFAKNLGQLYLSSKYNEVGDNTEKEANLTTPSLTSSSKQGYTITKLGTSEVTGIDDFYTMIGGNGAGKLRCPYYDSDPKIRDGLLIEFPVYFKLTSISLTGDNLAIKIYGSNNNVDFTTIYEYVDTSVGIQNGITGYETLSITNNNYYKYYKILGTNWNSGTGYMYNNIKLSGKSLTELKGNKLFITKNYSNERLDDYENGLIVKIITPSSYVTGLNLDSVLNIYELGEKIIPNDLKPSSRYTLVYDGTKFIHDN